MIAPGLCSVTLRAASVDEVARLAGECGLTAIEWGADAHVPPDDSRAIARAKAASTAAGVAIASYGSYLFTAGAPDEDECAAVLDTVAALGAPNVRVWAGFGVEPGTDAYRILVDDLVVFSDGASARGITVGVEYHGGTVTATLAATIALLDDVGSPNVASYWQPPYWRAPTLPEDDAAEVTALGDRLHHLHVYEWAGPDDRRPLAEGTGRWKRVLAAVGALGGDRVAFLEFVAADDPDALRRDAATLRSWLDPSSAARNPGS